MRYSYQHHQTDNTSFYQRPHVLQRLKLCENKTGKGKNATEYYLLVPINQIHTGHFVKTHTYLLLNNAL